jgi:beta-mannosidase
VGSSSYYGVGAYRRPLEDARRSNLRFASECLAFANVPAEATLAAMTPGTLLQVHHPLWKRRVPRDLGAGWDFDDVRDHYFELLCGERPIDVRYAERDRFFEQSRIVSAEVMAAAFREWRRPGSSCRGALIWFLRDLWRGAGWGIVDAEGRPKAPYYLLRRLLQPRAVLFSDEGTNGLHLHAVNELATPLTARLTLTLIRHGGARSAQHVRELTVPARGSVSLVATELCEGFEDVNHAYRFGAPVLEAVAAQLHDHGGALLAEDFHLPNGLRAPRVADLSLEAIASTIDDDTAQIQVRSRALARHVWIDVEGFEAEDQYFHVAPLIDRRVLLRRRVPGAPLTGMIRAANAASGVRIESAS